MEDDLVEALSAVLLDDDGESKVDGLDADLLSYISGMLAGQISEHEHPNNNNNNHDDESFRNDLQNTVIHDVLDPFFESVSCPDELAIAAQQAVTDVCCQYLIQEKQHQYATTRTTGTTTRKLTQGIVSMSSTLSNNGGDDNGGGNNSNKNTNNNNSGSNNHEADEIRMMWGRDQPGAIRGAMANNVIDAHTTKDSAKDKRKARKAEAVAARKAFIAANGGGAGTDPDQDGNLVGMHAIQPLQLGSTASSSSASTAAASTGLPSKNRNVQLNNITVSLDNGTVLVEQSDLKLTYQRRYGLIGENGVGKTTLLRAIASGDASRLGVSERDAATLNSMRILHVRQEVPQHLQQADMTVLNAVIQSDAERTMLLKQQAELTTKLEGVSSIECGGGDAAAASKSIQEQRKAWKQKLDSTAGSGSSSPTSLQQQFTADLQLLDHVLARLQILQADSAEARAAMILSGLQFTPAMQHATLASLSGGWKMRVALAAALFVQPDICLLDEPTNHLDLEAVLWLETYLQDYPNTIMVVSHDRGFLNEVCTDIIDFKRKRLTYYRGNFDNYVKLRDEHIRNSMREYQAYQAKRDHIMEFIDKFRANAKRATMVQSRIKAVEKMDAEAPEVVEMDPVWRFSIPGSDPVGRPIISINDVSFDYVTRLPDGSPKPESQFLLQQVNFGVDLDSRIAILGANGQGKTTLLNLVMGKLKPMSGSVHINANLRIAHFTQHSSDHFTLQESALENMLNLFPDAEDLEMRSWLGRFQIQGDMALKPMILLSGGQKSRVAFAALAYRKPHVLIIDEGSNHLSMDAVDALVEAVQDFKGGVLVVSHDQYFVSKTCTELWVVHQGHATRFRGDFDEYKKHTAEQNQKRVEESVKRMNALNKS